MDRGQDFTIKNLGPCQFDSPISDVAKDSAHTPKFVEAAEQILLDDRVAGPGEDDPGGDEPDRVPSLEVAGPRRRLFFDPARTGVGIVTCGGLCPGINDVIRALVMQSYHRYGIRHIWGFRYGFRGFIEKYAKEVVNLDI